MQDQNRSDVLQAWSEAGLYDLPDPRLQRFIRHFETELHSCWPDLMLLIRESCEEYRELLLTPIWDTGQKMLRLGMIQTLASDRNDDVQIFQHLARRPDKNGIPWEREALMRMARRRGLTT